MQLEPECIGCLFNQLLRAFKLLDPSIPRQKILDAQKELMKFLINFNAENNASPVVGRVAYGIVSSVLGLSDPYKRLKREYNQQALNIFDDVKKLIENSQDPLLEAILISALGNTIDLASQHEINFIEDLRKYGPKDLKINDYKQFREDLNKTCELLIIGDNAGEIVFDKLLILTLQDKYPHLKIIYSVRSAPIINDVTIKDAEFVGLTKLVPVVESCATPGIEILLCGEDFKHLFYKQNEMILSKGQGNFESLYGMHVPNKNIYYLLKAKCNLMERIFDVKMEDLIFMKKREGF
jgi:uncharacterized protein with ATP-grasp and redox domains